MDVLVMVDALHRAFEVSRLDRVLERANVPDIGHGVPIGGGAYLVYLVVLVI